MIKCPFFIAFIFLLIYINFLKCVSLYIKKKNNNTILASNNKFLFPLKNYKSLNFINPVKNVYKYTIKLNEHKKSIKDVIKESINLPTQFLPTTYNSFDRQILVQELWNKNNIYEKRNFSNIKKCIYSENKDNLKGETIRGALQNSLTYEMKNGKKNKTKFERENILKNNLMKYLQDNEIKNVSKHNELKSFSKKNIKKKYILPNLFNRLIKKIKIIHDGPPYANNDIHIGHILNKIIKDIYLKFFLLKNFFVLLIHGFDTHGLPIEYNVMKLLKINNVQDINLNDYPFNKIGCPNIYTSPPSHIFNKIRALVKKKELNNLFHGNLLQKHKSINSLNSQSEDNVMKRKVDNFKTLCKLYSSHFINKQFISLISYGIWGYWNYSYITFYKFYEQIQRSVFENLLKKKYVYISNRPIYHSHATKTVLSDSEIIYKNRICNSFYYFYNFYKIGDNYLLAILKNIRENKLINEITQLSEEEIDYCQDNYEMIANYIQGNNFPNNNYLKTVISKIRNSLLSNIKILVFTTQIYTIFNNKALLIHDKYLYRIVKGTYENSESVYFLICDKSFDMFFEKFKKFYSKKNKIIQFKTIATLQGNCFNDSTYYNFINKQENKFLLVNKNEVDENFGSGIVHIAPSHGFTDYNLYYKNNELKKVYLNKSNYDNVKNNLEEAKSEEEIDKVNKGGKEKNGNFLFDLTNQNAIDENDDLKEEYNKMIIEKCKQNIHLVEKYEDQPNQSSILKFLKNNESNNYNCKQGCDKININQNNSHLLFFYAFYENIFFYFPYEHSYPFDWRSHTPVQVKSLLQIYIDIEKIKNNKYFFKSIKNINFLNNNNKNYLINTMENRNEWCLSRQKYWGLNIPLNDIKLNDNKKISFKNQIMDVWFDSSVSYLYVLHMCKHILYNIYLKKILSAFKNEYTTKLDSNKFIDKGDKSILHWYTNNKYLNVKPDIRSFYMYDIYKEITQNVHFSEMDLLKNIIEKKKIFDPQKNYKNIIKEIKNKSNYFKINKIDDIIFNSNKKKDIYKNDLSIFLCCEGIDQIRGWFQSFFFIYFILNYINGKNTDFPSFEKYLPIKNLIVHNYVVDQNNVKMSKSLNNVISPRDIFLGINNGGNKMSKNVHAPVENYQANGQPNEQPNSTLHMNENDDKDKCINNSCKEMKNVKNQFDDFTKSIKEKKKFNADIVRLWVCCYNFLDRNISISHDILENINKHIYLKIYNTLKFLLNNIYDLNFAEKKIEYNSLQIMDKYILYKKDCLIKNCLNSYKNFQLQLLIKYILNFIHKDLAIYIDYSKDRLYIHEKNSINRKNCQKVFYNIIIDLLRILAPITPHLCEDLYQSFRNLKNSNLNKLKKINGKIKSIFSLPFPKIKNYKEVNLDILFLIKYYIHKQLNSYFSNSLLAIVYIYCDNDEVLNLLKQFLKNVSPLDNFNNHDDLRFVFNVSNIILCNNLSDVQKMDENYKTYKIPLLTNIMNSNTNDNNISEDFFQKDDQKHDFENISNFDEHTKYANLSIGIKKSESHRCSRCWMYGETVSFFRENFFCPRCLDIIKKYL
ncbi:isoleucine--tRNA ligase, putative [Plasmodium vinckei petteri]|uniref:Isoleucine--tRNA ligase, putative n=1 Tax=Plasmodium vinckei petteri TaxID=138298 RepID=A0A6V7TH01_PLAVN|nr:isoleucine--tRNA ligase, putative [Plasmodium vinckei petteri]